MAYSHCREFEILIACGWNVNIGTGYDILSSLLKMSNPSYNFAQMMEVTQKLATELIMCSFRQPTGTFNLFQTSYVS